MWQLVERPRAEGEPGPLLSLGMLSLDLIYVEMPVMTSARGRGNGRKGKREGLEEVGRPLKDLKGVAFLPRVVLDHEDRLLVCDPFALKHTHDHSQVSESRAVDEHHVWFAPRTRMQPPPELLARHLPLKVCVELGVEALAGPLGALASLNLAHDILAEVVEAECQLVHHLDVALLLPPPLRVLKHACEALVDGQAPVPLLLLAQVVQRVHQMVRAAGSLRRPDTDRTDRRVTWR
eukprot:762768-Hanusia_phi.AAC.4